MLRFVAVLRGLQFASTGNSLPTPRTTDRLYSGPKEVEMFQSTNRGRSWMNNDSFKAVAAVVVLGLLAALTQVAAVRSGHAVDVTTASPLTASEAAPTSAVVDYFPAQLPTPQGEPAEPLPTF